MAKRVYLDTNILIYLIEGHEDFTPLAAKFLEQEAAAKSHLFVSDLSKCECLMGPMKQGNHSLIAHYESLLAEAADFKPLPFDPSALEQVPELAADYSLKIMDAMHLALALQAGCDAFATNDRGFEHAEEVIDFLWL